MNVFECNWVEFFVSIYLFENSRKTIKELNCLVQFVDKLLLFFFIRGNFGPSFFTEI